jgi:hypothetical protein
MDWSAIDNLWRLPGAVISGVVLYPAIGIRMRCSECGCGFVSSRDGAEASYWEPINERTAPAAQADSA